jgi:DNA-directed RNA polymerase specialized sigma24 family protein
LDHGLYELDREMLRLLAWDRLSIAQIAAVTGLSRSAAARRLDAVTERLNEQSPGIAGNADDRLWMPSGVVS